MPTLLPRATEYVQFLMTPCAVHDLRGRRTDKRRRRV